MAFEIGASFKTHILGEALGPSSYILHLQYVDIVLFFMLINVFVNVDVNSVHAFLF